MPTIKPSGPSRHLLTKRELEILYLIAEEYSTKEIGDELSIAIGTVESHRRNIFVKLGAGNMAGAIHKAYQYGIFSTPRYL